MKNSTVKTTEHFNNKLATVRGPAGTFFVGFQFSCGTFWVTDKELRMNAVETANYYSALELAQQLAATFKPEPAAV